MLLGLEAAVWGCLCPHMGPSALQPLLFGQVPAQGWWEAKD